MTSFYQQYHTNGITYSKEVGEYQKVSFLRRQIKPCLFFEVFFKELC